MRLTLDTRPALCERFPALTLPAIRERSSRTMVEARQRFLTHLLELSYSRQRVHAGDPDADRFSTGFLQAGIHAIGSPGMVGQLLSPFFEFPEGQTGINRFRGMTRPYRLRSEVADALDAVLSTDEPLGAFVEGIRWDDVRSFAALRDNGVPTPVSKGLHVPKVLPLSLATVDAVLSTIRERIDREGPGAPFDPRGDPQGIPLETARRLLTLTRKWTVSFGGLPNLLTLDPRGRLRPVGFHVSVLPLSLRSQLLRDSGLVEYRIVDGPWPTVADVTKALRLRVPALRAYLSDRAACHARWATIAGGIAPEAIATVVAAWLRGAPLSSSRRTLAGRMLGPDAVRALRGHSEVMRLRREIARTVVRIADRGVPGWATDHRTSYVNAVGAIFRPWCPWSEVPPVRRCTHVLDGYREWALKRACQIAGGAAAVLPDGFLAGPGDPEGWADAIAEASARTLGVVLRVRIEPTPLAPIPASMWITTPLAQSHDSVLAVAN